MIGKMFWRVEYNGSIIPYKVLEVLENGDFKMSVSRPITRITDFEYALVDEEKETGFLATSEFNPATCGSSHQFFEDIELAKVRSLENFEKEVNPNAKYRVAQYFDDVFEMYVSEPMPKKEAIAHRNQQSNARRHYVSFGIVAQK